MRVYEVAKELNTSNKRLLEICSDAGISVKNHMSQLNEDHLNILYDFIGINKSTEINDIKIKEKIKDKDFTNVCSRDENVEAYPEIRLVSLFNGEIGRKVEYVYNLVENSRKRYGTFKKCEFHIHTPASSDFKLTEKLLYNEYINASVEDILSIAEQANLYSSNIIDTIRNNMDYYTSSSYIEELIKQNKPYSSFKEYISYKLIAQKLYCEKIEVAIVSDHNTVKGYEKLKYALKEYHDENIDNVNQYVHLLLGVEISCSDENHVVGIFDNNSLMQVESFLSDIVMENCSGAYLPALYIIEEINKLGGIGYIAHINSSNLYGNDAYKKKLFNLDYMTLLGISDKGKIDAQFARIKPHLANEKEFCFILEGDSHAIEEIGIKNVWVKFSKISFQALKKALEDYGICIRLSEPKNLSKYIKGMVIVPGKHGFLKANGRSETKFYNVADKDDFFVEFSQDLNCVIGGRGTGKSTLLNMIDLCFNLESEDSRTLKFISKNEQIFIVFHFNKDDYILRFLPQVEEIHEEGQVKFLRNAFTKYFYEKDTNYELTKNWVELYQVYENDKNENKKYIKRIEDFSVLNEFFKREYSINSLISKINDGTIGDFIRDTIMNGLNYSEVKEIIDEMVSLPRRQVVAFLQQNVDEIGDAYNRQKEFVESKIRDFNRKYKKQLQVIYSPNNNNSEFYLDDLLDNITDKNRGNVVGTFLTWDEVDRFIRLCVKHFGYIRFLSLILKSKYSDIEKNISIKGVVDNEKISIKQIEDGLQEVGDKNIFKVYKAIRQSLFADTDLLSISIEKWLITADDFTFMFNVNYKESVRTEAAIFKNINELSLGQKVAALLTFIFNYGAYSKDNTPLIIDQPEDNLDNQYIYKNLIDSLKTIKNQRQVIIVTHSSTIVTNADAEQVIVLESNNKNGWLDTRGYPSDDLIVKHVINYMEGGIESFVNKYKKYRLFINELRNS